MTEMELQTMLGTVQRRMTRGSSVFLRGKPNASGRGRDGTGRKERECDGTGAEMDGTERNRRTVQNEMRRTATGVGGEGQYERRRKTGLDETRQGATGTTGVTRMDRRMNKPGSGRTAALTGLLDTWPAVWAEGAERSLHQPAYIYIVNIAAAVGGGRWVGGSASGRRRPAGSEQRATGDRRRAAGNL